MLQTLSKIIEQIKNEFEEVQNGLSTAQDVFQNKFGNNLSLPTGYCSFLKLHNGMKRVKDDDYFTFQIFPVDKLMPYDQLGEMDEEERCTFLGLDKSDKPSDWIIVASEGEFGNYIMNCSPASSKFGMMYGMVNNIPEQFKVWKSFEEFLEGLIAYCEKCPLSEYVEELPGSCPLYGYR